MMNAQEITREVSHSLFLEHSFDAVLAFDTALRIVAANRDLERNLAAARSGELIGKPLSRLHFPNFEKLAASFLADESDRMIDTTLTLKAKDETRIFDIKLSRVPDDDGKTALVFAFLREITFEVQREERLWQSNEELSILYEISKVEVQSLKHEEILANVLQKFSELTNLSEGFFIRGDSENGIADFVGYNLDGEELAAFRLQLSGRRLPACLSGLEARVRHIGRERGAFIDLVRDSGYHWLVTIPVLLKETLFGVLVFLAREGAPLRLSPNRRFFTLIGQQVGLALEKAMLFNELEHSFHEIERKNRQLNEEIALAQKMQRGILSLNFPKKPGLGFAVKYIPSYHLSGDFYDIFEISENMVGVLIADVCGHGINAALVTSFLKASVRDMSQNFRRPDELLASLNAKLCDLLSTQMFVSAFYLIIDLKEKAIHFSNAGHPYPLLYRARERDVVDLQADGTLLSVLPDSQYCAVRQPFFPGDRVVLYTDGVFDMKNKAGEYVPMDFVRSLTARNARLDGYDFIEELLARLYRFGEIERFDDDINLIVVDFFNETAEPDVTGSRAIS